MPEIWVATLETRNFIFEAAGESEAAARFALVDGLLAHGRQYALPHRWFDHFADDGVLGNVRRLEAGRCYRDGEPI